MSKEPIDILIERQVNEPEAVAKERVDRILRVLELKVPDRVPVGGLGGDILPYYGGITWYDLSYDLEKGRQAVLRFAKDFPQDFPFILAPYGLEGFILALAFADFPDYSNVIRFLIGPVHDILKDKWSRWPGRELDVHHHPQFLGGEYMEPKEYKQLIENPIEFIHQVVLPRACPGLGKPGSSQWNGALIRIGLTLQKISSF